MQDTREVFRRWEEKATVTCIFKKKKYVGGMLRNLFLSFNVPDQVGQQYGHPSRLSLEWSSFSLEARSQFVHNSRSSQRAPAPDRDPASP